MIASIPAERTEEQKRRREELFRLFDPNGNGYLSLAECDKGVMEILGLEAAGKPAIMRAFQAAKDVHRGPSGGIGDDYVTRSEFRLFLLYLKQHLELWEIFGLIDSGEDRRIDLGEFRAAVPLLREWGCEILDADATFAEIDADHGGQILFVEFSAWAITKNLVRGVGGRCGLSVRGGCVSGSGRCRGGCAGVRRGGRVGGAEGG